MFFHTNITHIRHFLIQKAKNAEDTMILVHKFENLQDISTPHFYSYQIETLYYNNPRLKKFK